MTSSVAPTFSDPAPAQSPAWRPTIDAYEPTLARAATAAARFVASMTSGESGHWLTLAGPVGCGKTMLARQIFAEAKKHNTAGNASIYVRSKWDESDRRPGCAWFDVMTFAKRMRGGEYDLPEYLARDFIVVMDDLGAERDTSGFIADAMFRFCNARLGKWTCLLYTSDAADE